MPTEMSDHAAGITRTDYGVPSTPDTTRRRRRERPGRNPRPTAHQRIGTNLPRGKH